MFLLLLLFLSFEIVSVKCFCFYLVSADENTSVSRPPGNVDFCFCILVFVTCLLSFDEYIFLVLYRLLNKIPYVIHTRETLSSKHCWIKKTNTSHHGVSFIAVALHINVLYTVRRHCRSLTHQCISVTWCVLHCCSGLTVTSVYLMMCPSVTVIALRWHKCAALHDVSFSHCCSLTVTSVYFTWCVLQSLL